MEKSQNNFALTADLQKLGLSPAGARQVLAAQIVTDQKDRDLLAKMIGAVYADVNRPVSRYYLENAWPSK